MIERSIYDVFLCVGFGGDGYTGNATLGTDVVSDTTLGSGAGWGAITGDCEVNSDFDVV